MEQLRRVIDARKPLPLVGVIATMAAGAGCGSSETTTVTETGEAEMELKLEAEDYAVADELVKTPGQRRSFAQVCRGVATEEQFIRLSKEGGVDVLITEYGGRITPVLKILYERC